MHHYKNITCLLYQFVVAQFLTYLNNTIVVLALGALSMFLSILLGFHLEGNAFAECNHSGSLVDKTEVYGATFHKNK